MDPITVMVISIISGTLFAQISKEDYWYDYLNNYMSFPKEDTDLIDKMLINNPMYSKIGKRKIIGGTSIPDEGYHYYYFESESRRGWFFNYYIGLRKIKKTDNNNNYYVYDAWISPWSKSRLEIFTGNLRIQEKNSVRTIGIDCSSMSPEKKHGVKIYYPPRTHQQEIINIILREWENNNYNYKVMIHGNTGVGKTETAYGLTKILEEKYQTKRVLLFDNFNPTSIGVNIESLALEDAKENTPIILVINEIDVAFRASCEQKQFYDPRGSHTNDKTSFNNMLDVISKKKHVIGIYTSEKSPTDLIKENPSFASFMRKGRMDLYVEMSTNSFVSTIVA